MTQPQEPVISESIASWIGSEGGDQALLFVTIDAASRPHVILLATGMLPIPTASGSRS